MLILAGSDVVTHLLDYPLIEGVLSAHAVLMIITTIVMVWGFSAVAKHAKGGEAPGKKGWTAIAEVGLVWVRDEIVYAWLGEKEGRKWLFFFWTLFFWLLFSNLLGLFPFPLNPWQRGHTGNLAVTGSFAAMAFIAICTAGISKHGVGGFIKHFVPPGVPLWLAPLVWLIEVVGLFVKPFALMVRLTANMTAGHAILAVLFGFMFGVAHYDSVAVGGAANIASFLFILFIMLFETLVALIQAFIFTVLTAIFMSQVVAEDH